jgi:RNA-directed DNA polymerase
MVWTTLAHNIDVDLLCASFAQIRKRGATGVDNVTAEQYGASLEKNLSSLLERFRSGSYQAPPVRRVHIPKGDGKTRPIGIPTVEDKILQRGVTSVLNAVYEQSFLDCSYGFRPGRSAKQAIEVLREGIMQMRGGFVLDVDIKSFFDTIDHERLREILDRRVRDGVIRRAIGKWLTAGVLEDGEVRRIDEGTPQGGVISPLLANIYLHEVLDLWFEHEIKPRLSGRAFMIRFADDFVLVFSSEVDARRVLDVLPKRFAKYGLELHPEKTRLVRFKPPSKDDGDGPGTFDFLGFTHYWAKSRRGYDVVLRKTSKQRLARALKRVNDWCRWHRHDEVGEQREKLRQKMQGHFNYYGIIGNSRALYLFAHEVRILWRKWLDRRSWRARMTWARFSELLKRHPLPRPQIRA